MRVVHILPVALKEEPILVKVNDIKSIQNLVLIMDDYVCIIPQPLRSKKFVK